MGSSFCKMDPLGVTIRLVLWSLGIPLLVAGSSEDLWQEVQTHVTADHLMLDDLYENKLLRSNCYDRSSRPFTAIVDAHLHTRPFGGSPKGHAELSREMHSSGVLVAAMTGIGQEFVLENHICADSDNNERPCVNADVHFAGQIETGCVYYLDDNRKPGRHCDQVDIRPSNHNDVINAQIYRSSTDSKLLWLPSMTFADLSKPETVLPGIEYLERRFGLGTFRSMGELNVVKQALFTGQRQGMTSGRPVTLDEIAQWSPFMAALRQRNMPIHLHSDLGNNSHPLQYWPLIQRVLELYPDNKIVWLHLGLCVELSEFTGGPQQHIAVLEQALSSHKHLRLDLSWDVLWNDHFQKPERQPFYILFIRKSAITPFATSLLANPTLNYSICRSQLRWCVDIQNNRQLGPLGSFWNLLNGTSTSSVDGWSMHAVHIFFYE